MGLPLGVFILGVSVSIFSLLRYIFLSIPGLIRAFRTPPHIEDTTIPALILEVGSLIVWACYAAGIKRNGYILFLFSVIGGGVEFIILAIFTSVAIRQPRQRLIGGATLLATIVFFLLPACFVAGFIHDGRTLNYAMSWLCRCVSVLTHAPTAYTIFTVYRSKKAESLSPSSFGSLALASVGWLAYWWYARSTPLLVSALAGLFVGIVQGIVYWWLLRLRSTRLPS